MRHEHSLSAVILTYNEEKHIARCINSLKNVCDEIWVIDSYSTDRTVEIAERLGAKTVRHTFENQAQQFNWAIHHCDISAEWIWRVDADEYISEDLGEKVTSIITSCDEDVNGIYVNKRIVFLGRPLMHGGWYPAPQIKVIRRGFGESENKVMDEHLIVTSGRTVTVDGDQTDENLNDLTWWTEKHNRYASREAVNMLRMQLGMDEDANGVEARLFGNDAERKRWLKLRYARMPLFLRPFLYFLARYILKGGFLDGKAGLIWYVLQGFWYRFLVDAKIFEIKRSLDYKEDRIKAYLEEKCLTSINKQGGVKCKVLSIAPSLTSNLATAERRAYAA